jgi:hypothetical protein
MARGLRIAPRMAGIAVIEVVLRTALDDVEAGRGRIMCKLEPGAFAGMGRALAGFGDRAVGVDDLTDSERARAGPRRWVPAARGRRPA